MMPDVTLWLDDPRMQVAFVFLVAYGIGSIPFGLVLTHWAGLGDIRAIGSGNIGATNVLRTGKKSLAIATLLLDGLKGTAAVLLLRALHLEAWDLVAVVAAFLGHVFPIWLRFRGGKGVATLVGLAGLLYWPSAVAFIAIWLGTAYAFRYSSLSALVASMALPPLFYALSSGSEALVFAFLVALLWFRHSTNIARLWAGTESKIGDKG
jgi:acyl phosphate:glycerol-3-phosphate acyltransferase